VENREIIRRRQRARKILVQALYQWQFNESDISEIQAQYITENNPDKFDQQYFCDVLKGVTSDVKKLDEEIIPLFDRAINLINPVEFAILRLSTYEFIHCLDVPFKVVIDEAISLSKTFGATEGHRYVNGVLHQLAEKLRPLELSKRKK
jgi:N utilization substance protein B